MSKTIHIGVFIDGTGNHKDNDELIGNGTQSNVAKLHKVFLLTEGNLQPIYIEGVGTSSFKELGFKSVDGKFKDAQGNFYDERLQAVKEGEKDINDYYDTIPMGTGYGIGGRGVEDQVDEAFTKIERKIDFVQRTQPDTEIYIDIVGFSRGAASSRALVNRLHEAGITGEGSKTHINFVGLFDTVSTIGRADGDNGDLNLNLNNDSANHIIQFVAKDEIRANFRSESLGAFDKVTRGAHGDTGGSYGILDNKEYYATFENYRIKNDKVSDFIKAQYVEAKEAGYEGISYDITSMDRNNESNVYMGYVYSREVKYGLSHVSLNKMHEEMKASHIPMTGLHVLGNVENNASYSQWEIPKALQAHPEDVNQYIHNSSVDRIRVYPGGEDFRRSRETERLAHHSETSKQRSIDNNEPSKAAHPHTLAYEMQQIDKGYAYTQDSQTTKRPEEVKGMYTSENFVQDKEQVVKYDTFDSIDADKAFVEDLNLSTDNGGNNDQGYGIGD